MIVLLPHSASPTLAYKWFQQTVLTLDQYPLEEGIIRHTELRRLNLLHKNSPWFCYFPEVVGSLLGIRPQWRTACFEDSVQ